MCKSSKDAHASWQIIGLSLYFALPIFASISTTGGLAFPAGCWGVIGWSMHPLLQDPGLSSPLKFVPSSPLGGLAQPVLSVGVHQRVNEFFLLEN